MIGSLYVIMMASGELASTEVVYGVTDPDVTGLPEYGVLP